MNISDVNNDGIGMDGFDPVSHFEGQPLRGSDEYSFALGDITYYFSSPENLNRFEENPAKYIPIGGAYPTGTKVANPDIQQDEKSYIGNKTYDYRRNLEDTPVSLENQVPTDIKETDDLEMGNLSDSEK